MSDHDPRLVDLYDEDNPDGPDHDFYRSLADELAAECILDLGCGTGILTVTLARDGRRVVGIDPSRSMLAYARRRPRSELVEWVLGVSRDIPAGAFDFAVMTGNVAQHIPDTDWAGSLRDLRAALVPGGTLAFETRNPAARAWETWAAEKPTTRRTIHGPLTEWMDAEETSPGTVTLVAHNRFQTGEVVTETQTLTFRDLPVLDADLRGAGFSIDAVYGDWRRSAVTDTSPLFVVVARAA